MTNLQDLLRMRIHFACIGIRGWLQDLLLRFTFKTNRACAYFSPVYASAVGFKICNQDKPSRPTTGAYIFRRYTHPRLVFKICRHDKSWRPTADAFIFRRCTNPRLVFKICQQDESWRLTAYAYTAKMYLLMFRALAKNLRSFYDSVNHYYTTYN